MKVEKRVAKRVDLLVVSRAVQMVVLMVEKRAA